MLPVHSMMSVRPILSALSRVPILSIEPICQYGSSANNHSNISQCTASIASTFTTAALSVQLGNAASTLNDVSTVNTVSTASSANNHSDISQCAASLASTSIKAALPVQAILPVLSVLSRVPMLSIVTILPVLSVLSRTPMLSIVTICQHCQ